MHLYSEKNPKHNTLSGKAYMREVNNIDNITEHNDKASETLAVSWMWSFNKWK